jgi:hypothetical protein
MRQEERDLRSLDRRSMYLIFGPLDPDERLPRELLLERSRFHPFQGNPPWERVLSILWIPALLVTLAALAWWLRLV